MGLLTKCRDMNDVYQWGILSALGATPPIPKEVPKKTNKEKERERGKKKGKKRKGKESQEGRHSSATGSREENFGGTKLTGRVTRRATFFNFAPGPQN